MNDEDMQQYDLPSNWEFTKGFLPEGWQGKMQELGLLKFGRKFAGAEGCDALLRTMMIHLAGNVSLRSTCTIAREGGIVNISDVGLLKRVDKSAEWFNWMTHQLQASMGHAPCWPSDGDMQSYRWRLVDGTVVREPGATGSNWRLHYALDARTLIPDQVVAGDYRTGEKFHNFTIAPGDVMLADRGYCTRSGIHYLAAGGAFALSRFAPGNLPLHTTSGTPYPLLDALRQLQIGDIGHYPACVIHEGERVPVRICAIRKSPDAAERSRRQLQRNASRHGYGKMKPNSLEFADYTLIITSLPEAIEAKTILAIYRYRWQIELLFKRLKSILSLSPLHKRSAAGMRGWLSGKIFVAALIEHIRNYAAFSPWGYPASQG